MSKCLSKQPVWLPTPKNADVFNGSLLTLVLGEHKTLLLNLTLRKHEDPYPARCQVWAAYRGYEATNWNSLKMGSQPSMNPSVSVQKTVLYLTEEGVELVRRTVDGGDQPMLELVLQDPEDIAILQ